MQIYIIVFVVFAVVFSQELAIFFLDVPLRAQKSHPRVPRGGDNVALEETT